MFLFMLPRNHAGFILLTTLLFLQIYFALIITMNEYTKQTAKISSAVLDNHMMLNTHNKLLEKLATTWLYRLPSCIVDIKEIVAWTQHDLIWWQHYACSGIFVDYNYYYVLAHLASKPDCSYYRVLFLLVAPSTQTILLAQAGLVKNITKHHPCHASDGLQSVQII